MERAQARSVGAFPGGHPDPNLLSAFAENALPRSERDFVASHLSSCAECRECLATAFATAVPEPAPVIRRTARPRLWLAFAGAAAAASVVAVLWIVHKPAAPINETAAVVTRPAAPGAVSPPAVLPQVSPRSTPRALIAHKSHVFVAPSAAAPVTTVTEEAQATPPPPKLEPSQSIAADRLAMQQSADVAARAPTPAEPAAASNGFVAQRRAAPAMAGSFEAKARKALPAPLVAEPLALWTVDGAVQRSIDGGRTWQTVAVDPSVTFRAISSAGRDVWAGGSGGALYHSADAGGHWMRIEVTDDTGNLTGAVVAIDAAHAPAITVTTSTGERWSSFDGGQRWKRD